MELTLYYASFVVREPEADSCPSMDRHYFIAADEEAAHRHVRQLGSDGMHRLMYYSRGGSLSIDPRLVGGMNGFKLLEEGKAVLPLREGNLDVTVLEEF